MGLLKQEIIFVTGKGGVGKSAVAAGIALAKAKSGKSTLLVELGNQSFYKDYFNLPHVGYQPVSLQEPGQQAAKGQLDVALWSGAECLKEYARHLLKVEALYQLFFENPVSRSLINVAPALPELSILGKITSHPRQVGPPLNYDCLVIDAYSTGHFLALLRAPVGMAAAVRFGPMGEQSKSIDRVIKDSDHCSYYVVSIPEEMPVLEAMELNQELKKLIGLNPVHLFNKVLAVDPKIESEKPVEQKLKDFQSYILKKDGEQKQFADRLKSQSEMQIVPYVLSTDPWKVVNQIAEQFTEAMK